MIMVLAQLEDNSIYPLVRTVYPRHLELGTGLLGAKMQEIVGAGDAVSTETTSYFHVTPAGKKKAWLPFRNTSCFVAFYCSK